MECVVMNSETKSFSALNKCILGLRGMHCRYVSRPIRMLLATSGVFIFRKKTNIFVIFGGWEAGAGDCSELD